MVEMTEFHGIPMTMEEREALESNGIEYLTDLCDLSPSKLSKILGDTAGARQIEDTLNERGMSLKNSQKKSLRTFA